MKRILVLLSVGLVLNTYAVNTQENELMLKRKSAIEALDAYKGSMVDSTEASLKELVIAQSALIDADKNVVDIYLDSLKSKTDTLSRSVNNLTIDKETAEKKVKTYEENKLYVMIGGGALFLLFIVFLILFFLASGKKNKYKKQVKGIDKMKEDNKKEIEIAKKQVEVLKANAQKEINEAKEKVASESKNLQIKIDTLNTEKTSLEKKLSDKSLECSQLVIQNENTRNEYERKLKDASSQSGDFTNQKLALEKEIFDKNQLIETLNREKNEAKRDFDDYKTLYEKEVNERKSLESRLNESESRNNTPSENQEGDYLRNENNRLKEEIERIANERTNFENQLRESDEKLKALASNEGNNEAEYLKTEISRLKEDIEHLNERIDKEKKGKNLIEDELRRLIEELRNIR